MVVWFYLCCLFLVSDHAAVFSRIKPSKENCVPRGSSQTFQLFRRLRYWEFYKRTKTLRIRDYGPLRYAVPKNVNFSNGNNRFRVNESEVNFRRGVKKLLKMAIMISFIEPPMVILSRYANVCFRSLSAITLSIVLWKHETPLVTPKGKRQTDTAFYQLRRRYTLGFLSLGALDNKRISDQVY